MPLWGSKRAQRLTSTIAAAALVGTGVFIAVGPPAAEAAPGESTTPIGNPDLSVACGIDILMVLDESGSVKNYKRDVQKAFRAFTSALKNTGSRLAVAEFSTVGRLPLTGAAQRAYTPVTDATIASTFEPYIDREYNPDGYTNWEDGFRVARYMLQRPSTQPHLVVFLTDGDPTRVIREDRVTYSPGSTNQAANEYELKVPLNGSDSGNSAETGSSNEDPGATRAIANANALKAAGSHVLALAVGEGLTSQSSLNRLIKISDDDVYSGTGDFDIATDDIYREADFSKLEAALRDAAFQLCSPSITVRKYVDVDPDPNVEELQPGAGFDLTAVADPVPATWVLPPGATGSTATTPTGGDGFASFQWETSAPTDSNVTITEADPTSQGAGLEFDPGATQCTSRTPDHPNDTPLPTTPVALGFTTTVPDGAIVTCSIVNRLQPAPAMTLEKFTNGSDSDTAPGRPIPARDPVTWQYTVTNVGNVDLNGLVVSDDQLAAGAVTCEATTLAPGHSTLCTATGTARPGAYANIGTATATGAFGTPVTATDPSHYFGTDPQVRIVKFVQGLDADTPSDGPTVPVGAEVTWSYTVQNVGNVPLTGITVTDDQEGDVECLVAQPAGLPPGGSIDCSPIIGTAVAGQYANIATVVATGAGQSVSDTNPAHYFGSAPQVLIEKATNGVDADLEADAPTVPAGAPVDWTYEVTNSGNVPLHGVLVTDDPADDADDPVTVACPDRDNVAGFDLDVGEKITCTATGTAREGLYANTATVVGTGPAGTVTTDSDPSHYFGGLPGIDLEKSTNGPGQPPEDADAAPGPFIPVGAPVTWTYTVTNTGNEALTNVQVTDSPTDASDTPVVVTCPGDLGDGITLLPGGAPVVCTATGTARAGQYENVSEATGLDSLGDPVTDSDASHYVGAVPDLELVKSTNSEDANDPTGPYVPVGKPVLWTYEVTNTGNVPLGPITVADSDPGVTVACPALDALSPGASTTCEALGLAQPGQYANTGTASATNPLDTGGPPITDDDPSHYFGSDPQVTVEKSTNGQDVDLPPGVYIPVGAPVEWTYTVHNTGNTPLTDIVVSDDRGVAVTCPGTDLAPDGSMVCTGAGTAQEGTYENLATVNAVSAPDGLDVTDDDPSHYFGTAPGVDIEKWTNGEDADDPAGPFVAVGDVVQWQYTVTNTGNVALEDVVVSDSDPAVDVVCPETEVFPGQPMVCFAEGAAQVGQYDNTGSVTAVDLAGTPVTDSDPSHYFGTDSHIDVEKATNGVDADTPPEGPYVATGSTVTWSYVVSNTGNAALSGIVVEDTVLGPVTCPSPTLAPGAEMTCVPKTGPAVAGQYGNVAIVTGRDPGGVEVTDNDASHYYGTAPGILVEKSTNGDDADEAPGPYVPVGDEIEWRYRVTNTGNTALSGVSVSDNQGVAVTCPRDTLAAAGPDRFMICTGTGTASLGQYENLATAVGTGQAGVQVTDVDPSHYYGYTSSIDLQKSTNGPGQAPQDADAAPGPGIPLGATVTWTYALTNTGNIDIRSFQVADSDPDVAVGCPKVGAIAPGATVLCHATGTAKTGQYENTATVTALDQLENPLTDSDPSHYFAATPAIDIEKATNGDDADAAPGPTVLVGDPVTWTYVVTNTGNVPLSAVGVTDDRVAVVTCPEPTLAVAASMTCRATGTAAAGQYRNLGTATGQFEPTVNEVPLRAAGTVSASQATTVSDSDPSHYMGVAPGIAVQKDADPEEVSPGDPVTFTITVTNTGGVALADVKVSDPQVPECDRTIASLPVGEDYSYECTLAHVEQGFTNVATAEGHPTRPGGGVVTSSSVVDQDDAVVTVTAVDHETAEPDDGAEPAEELSDTGADLGLALLTSLAGLMLVCAGLVMRRRAGRST